MGALFSLLGFASGSSETKILMVGLDGAGKTTILYKLKLDQVVSTTPTIGFNLELVEYRNLKLLIRDVGGQDRLRQLWQHYYEESDGIIFVVDSSDGDRIPAAKKELERLLEDATLQRCVVLVYANKQDLPGALGAPALSEALGVPAIQGRGFNVFVQAAVATEGDGVFEGLDFLANALGRR